MGLGVFSHEWARAWQHEINESVSFRRAGSGWEDTIAFVMTDLAAVDGHGERAVFLDLQHGQCRLARAAEPADLVDASFVIVSDRETWRDVLTGKLNLIMAVMRGKFSLRRGTLVGLLPHAGDAQALLATVQPLDTTY